MEMIAVRSFKVLDDDVRTRQEVDLNFLGSGFRRIVYVSTDPEFKGEIPPRRLRSPLTVVPIPTDPAASIVLTCMDPAGAVATVALLAAHSYYLSPALAYRIAVSGRVVLELFTPAAAASQYVDEEALAPDFFAAADGDAHA
jgi:hypothetical protein